MVGAGFLALLLASRERKLPWPQEGEELNPPDITWRDLPQLLEGAPKATRTTLCYSPQIRSLGAKSLCAFCFFAGI